MIISAVVRSLLNLLIPLALLLGLLIGGHEFVTADQYGFWAKDVRLGLIEALRTEGYSLVSQEDIDPDQVPLYPVQEFRVLTKELLEKIGLYSYKGYAWQFNLVNDEGDSVIVKTLLSGDHLQAVAVKSMPHRTSKTLIKILNDKFHPYKIYYENKNDDIKCSN